MKFTKKNIEYCFCILILIIIMQSVSICQAIQYLPTGPHPRIFLTPGRLSELKERAEKRTKEWLTLENWCSRHLNDKGWQVTTDTRWQEGYRMSAFAQHITNYALAYQILKTSNPSLANTYGKHAIDIMNATLKNFSAGEELDGIVMLRHGEQYDRTINIAEKMAIVPYYPQMTSATYKDGYAARDICISYALAYDWLHELLTEKEKSEFINLMYRWIDWIRGVRSTYNNGILRNGIRYYEDQTGDCTGINNCTSVTGNATKAFRLDTVPNNYFSGYFLLATLVPLATYGDNPDALAYLAYARATLFDSKFKPEVVSPLGSKGGDSTEGWNYAGGWFRDLQAVFALKQATGEDLFKDFNWPKEYLNCYINVTNSSLKAILNYGEITGNNGKSQPYQGLILSSAYILRMEYPNDDTSKLGEYYLNHATFANHVEEWNSFLWSDPTEQGKNFTANPLSYHAIGSGLVSMRSSWVGSSDTVFASVQLGGKMAPGVDHENYDQGNIFLYRGEDALLTHSNMERSAISYNTIIFNNMDHHADNPPLIKPAIDRIEDQDGFLYVRGNITNAWKREWNIDKCKLFIRNVVYVRPNYLVVYDATHSNSVIGLLKCWNTNYISEPEIDTNKHIISATVGNSKIFTKTIYPLDGILTKTALERGYWRAQLTPFVPQEFDQFLHVIEATASTSKEMVAVEKIQSIDSKLIGVFINDPDKPTVVVFSANENGDDFVGNISYSLPTLSSRRAAHIIVNLAPNTDYIAICPEKDVIPQLYNLIRGDDIKKGKVYKTSNQGVLYLPPATSM